MEEPKSQHLGVFVGTTYPQRMKVLSGKEKACELKLGEMKHRLLNALVVMLDSLSHRL